MNVAALALLLGIGLPPVVLVFLRRLDVLDVPNDRSAHVTPVVRGGGLAPAVAATTAVVCASQLDETFRLAFACVPLAFGAVGLGDDVRAMSPRVRLILQMMLTVLFIAILLDGGTTLTPLLIMGSMLWTIAVVNVFNFMDGINGIALGQFVTASATWWWLGQIEGTHALSTLAAIGGLAVVGTIPFNFPRAMMFLGDAGSYFLGAWLGLGVLVGYLEGVPVGIMALPLTYFFVDAATTMIRRIRRGEALLTAHRDHAYQRLARSSLGPTRTTLLSVALIATSGGLAILAVNAELVGQATAGFVAVVASLSFVSFADRYGDGSQQGDPLLPL